MKVGRVLVLIVVALLFLILFGDRGLVGFRESRDTLEALQAENSRIVEENERLRDEIILLRNDLDYIEQVARRELGMIGEGETVYRFREQ